MLYNRLTFAAAALASSALVSAQTFTDCNPLKTTCKPDPAFGKDGIDCDWTKGACNVFKAAEATEIDYNGQGAVFSIANEKQAPTIMTSKYIFFGRMDVEVQAASGAGIVTSCVLQSNDLDEIDWEWVGGDNKQAQSNYFSKGDTSTYDRGAYHPVANPLTSVNKYSVEWTKDAVVWMINDAPVRTLNAADAKGANGFPQTPMQVKIGTWCAGGKDTPEGTKEWAGGETDFSKGPFNAYYKSISVVDYAGGDGPTKDSIREYIYTDHSGSDESIKVVKGDGASDDSTTTKPKPKPTSTKEHKTTHTEAKTTKTKVAKTTTKTEAKETSTVVTSTKVVSTLTTAVSTGLNTTTAAPTTTDAGASETTSSAVATQTQPGAAGHFAVSFGSLALGGVAAAAAQYLL